MSLKLLFIKEKEPNRKATEINEVKEKGYKTIGAPTGLGPVTGEISFSRVLNGKNEIKV